MAALENIFGAGEGIIISTIHAGNQFIGANHVLVTFVTAVGGTVAAYRSFLNTRHLQRQAELQRQIETNRFNIELFNSRFRAYESFVNIRAPVLESDRFLPDIDFLHNIKRTTKKVIIAFDVKADSFIDRCHTREGDLIALREDISTYEEYLKMSKGDLARHEKALKEGFDPPPFNEEFLGDLEREFSEKECEFYLKYHLYRDGLQSVILSIEDDLKLPKEAYSGRNDKKIFKTRMVNFAKFPFKKLSNIIR
ncbi:hypothetical protein J4P41_13940 [Gluconobacter sp. NFX36]|uniref:hypothetical protein n=1 Tax=Gluconobacter sp. NFX36 TaxID=2819535 RepID=UPI003CEE5257